MNVQTKPKLFSTFMLSLLAEMYQKFPELGDVQKPKLVVFIDEAHLLFEEASKDLLNQIEQIVKLIRSKGVGIIFCTQNPIDIPDDVLAQLGLKVQHALRAFTAKDRDAIKKASENYPETDFYQVDKLITELGIDELGYLLRPPKSKKIAKDLFELRIISNISIRIFYTFYKDQILILDAFVKKSQKIPKKEIEKSLKILNNLH
jgi:phage-related protein